MTMQLQARAHLARRDLLVLGVTWLLGLLLSGWQPYDRLTWLMEVLPALLAWPLFWWGARYFQFSRACYALIALHGLILMLGGAYTYARVPLGFWMQEWFGFTRNNYDKIGHFAQGFVPAVVAYELLTGYFRIASRRLVVGLVIAICLAISACYEFIEWWSALLLGSGADEFLGTQGDPWDTQSDMFMAGIGATLAALWWRWREAARD